MAGISTRCKCGCEIKLETDNVKMFATGKTCHMCKEPVKFRNVEEAVAVEEASNPAEVAEVKPTKKKVVKTKKVKSAKHK
jgi:hypothetical protein